MEIKPVYLFYGEEAYLLTKDLQIFRQYFAQQECTVEEYDAAKIPLETILDAAATNPLFGAERLIIVSNSPWFAPFKKDTSGGEQSAKSGDKLKGQREALEAYISHPNDEVCLVFVAATASRSLKLVKAIASIGKVREYKKPREWELPPYLRQYLRKQGKNIAPAALDLLITIGGEDLGSLINECDKLVLYSGEADTVTENDVAKVVSQGAAANIFQLSDALGARNIESVRGLIANILSELKPGEYPKVFGYIVNYIRILLRLKEFISRGYNEKEIAAATKINAYRVKLAIPAAKRYSEDELIAALSLLLDVDFKMKSGRADFADSFPAALLAIAQRTDKTNN